MLLLNNIVGGNDLVEIQSFRMHNRTTGSSPTASAKGLMAYDTADDTTKYWNGSAWVRYSKPFKSGSAFSDFAMTDGNILTGSGSVMTEVARNTIPISAWGAATADVSMGTTYKITNLADPSSDTDAANKRYVDNAVQGLDAKQSVYIATTGALAACTYANGTAGVGATLTASANGIMANIDGVAPANGYRVLVKNQAAALQNGIYVVTDAGSVGTPWILTRAADANQAAELTSAYVFIENGVSLVNTGWVCQWVASDVIGTDPIDWVQFSSVGVPVEGNGIDITGNIVSLWVAGATTWTQGCVMVGSGTTTVGKVDASAVARAPLWSGGASTVPAYGPYSLPATVAANQLLYASSTTAVSALATGNTGYLSTDGSGVPSIVAKAAISKTDDTNVTLTLGGTPTTAVMAATSFTLGWTGQLSIARGGTNASSFATTNGNVYYDGTRLVTSPYTVPTTGVQYSIPFWSATGTLSQSTIANLYYTDASSGTLSIGSSSPLASTRLFVNAAAANNAIVGRQNITTATESIPLMIQNFDITAAINHQVGLKAQMLTTTSATVDAGKIQWNKEAEWTATGTTQDASFGIWVAVDGTDTERFHLSSAGNITLATWTANLIGLAYGGTNKNMTAVNGGIVWTDADSMEVSAAGSAGQILRSAGAAAPTWTGYTVPATGTQYAMPYWSATGTLTNTTITKLYYDDTAGVLSLGDSSPPANTVLKVAATSSQDAIVARQNITTATTSVPLSLRNLDQTSAIAHALGMDVDFSYTSGGSSVVTGGRIQWKKEAEWTSTASTQDSNFSVWNAVDGVLTERFRVASTGNITLGTWASTAVGLAYGGTNADLSAGAQGGLMYKAASAMAVSAAGSAGQMLLSAGTSAPTWTGYSMPSSLAGANNLFVSSSASVMGYLTATNYRVLTTDSSTGAITWGGILNPTVITGTTPWAGPATNYNIGRKYSAKVFGDGTNAYITVQHNLNTREVTWSLRNSAASDTGELEFVFTKVTVVDANNIKLYFNQVQTASNYYIVTVTG